MSGALDNQGNQVYTFSATRPQYLDNELFKGKGTSAYEDLMLANLRLDTHRDRVLGNYSTRNGAATPDTTLEELLLLGNAKVATGTTALVLGAANRLTGGRVTSKVLGFVDDFDGNAIPLYSASGKYAFERSPTNNTVTGANLEAVSKQFIQDTHGKDFIGFFDTKIGGNQGLDIGYAAMVNGKPQLFIVEAKAGDSPLTALGANKVETLNRNLGVLETSIKNSALDDNLKRNLFAQAEGRTFKLELHVGPDNAAKTAARMDSTLNSKINNGAGVSRVVQFNRK